MSRIDGSMNLRYRALGILYALRVVQDVREERLNDERIDQLAAELGALVREDRDHAASVGRALEEMLAGDDKSMPPSWRIRRFRAMAGAELYTSEVAGRLRAVREIQNVEQARMQAAFSKLAESWWTDLQRDLALRQLAEVLEKVRCKAVSTEGHGPCAAFPWWTANPERVGSKAQPVHDECFCSAFADEDRLAFFRRDGTNT